MQINHNAKGLPPEFPGPDPEGLFLSSVPSIVRKRSNAETHSSEFVPVGGRLSRGRPLLLSRITSSILVDCTYGSARFALAVVWMIKF